MSFSKKEKRNIIEKKYWRISQKRISLSYVLIVYRIKYKKLKNKKQNDI